MKRGYSSLFGIASVFHVRQESRDDAERASAVLRHATNYHKKTLNFFYNSSARCVWYLFCTCA